MDIKIKSKQEGISSKKYVSFLYKTKMNISAKGNYGSADFSGW